MRIVYFYQYFGTSKGGWSTRVYEMCRRWVDQGHQVTVITSPYDKSDIKPFKGLVNRFEIDGIDVIVLNVPQSNKDSIVKRIYRFIQYMVLAIRFVFKLKYDVAIASSGPITVGVLGIIAKKFRGKRFVFEVRDLWPAGSVQLGVLRNKLLIRLSFWFEALCYRTADLIVACSEGMADDIRTRFEHQHILVVPNACDTAFFDQYTDAVLPPAFQGKRLVIYAGSLGVMDHCMQIMEAARLLDRQRYPDVRFLILGEGVERPMMEAYKQEHRLDHVEFLGLVPKTQVAPLLVSAQCAIVCFKNVPMLNTVSPNKMFDSFAAGVPIVQTTQGWIKNMLQRTGAGQTVDADNPTQMIAAICRYLDDPAERNKAAASARQLAHGVFSRDKCAEDMLQAIHQLVPDAATKLEEEKLLEAQSSRSLRGIGGLKKVTFVIDWYTPSSHATSLRIRPWVEELQATGSYDISIYTDRTSRKEPLVKANIFPSPDNRRRAIVRITQELLLAAELFIKLLFASRRIVVVSSPPFLAACAAAIACIITRKPYVFDVRDLYPLVYANSGFLRKRSLAFRLLYRLARLCYRHSLFTSTVTPNLVEYLKGVSKHGKVVLLQNGFRSTLFLPGEERFDQFTLIFHGNIGQFQNPELLIAVCRELDRRKEDYRCIVIGSGSKQSVIERANLPKLDFRGRLSNEELAAIIRKGHVGLSFRTDDEISWRSMPVRVAEYIGIGIPCILTPQSEGGDLIDAYQVGKSFTNDQITDIVEFIVQLKHNRDLYNYYVANALRVRENFSREAGARLFVRNIERCQKMESF